MCGLVTRGRCVVIFVWFLGIMDCMLFTFEIEFCSCARDVSGVASFITSDEQLRQNRGCYLPMQTMLPEGFQFH